MKIKTNAEEMGLKKAPLLHIYPCEIGPQEAYIEIDTEKFTAEADYENGIGVGVPARVCNGLVRQYRINPYIKGTSLEFILNHKKFLSLAERICDGEETIWDGNNWVAELNSDAQEAEEELEKFLGNVIDYDDLYDEENED